MKPEDRRYSTCGMREGNPGSVEPDEIGKTEPAKTISATQHLDINQSQLGRDQGQTPADEHIEEFSQIDHESAKANESMKQAVRKEFDIDDFNRVDERDTGNSATQWDAEKSRTGRSK